MKEYLYKHGVNFTSAGYPIFTEDILSKEIPEGACPIGHTNHIKDKKNFLLVAFCNDEYIYRSIKKLPNELDYYLQFKAFGGFDLSPRINWDIKLQRFNLLINKLADAYLAVNGVKLIPNFRTGCLDTFDVLSIYPPNTWYSVGTLGSSKGHVKINELYLRTKLLITNPDMLIYYGTLKTEYKQILDEFGVPYKVFADFQRLSRGKEAV